jgi:hypothetical protein
MILSSFFASFGQLKADCLNLCLFFGCNFLAGQSEQKKPIVTYKNTYVVFFVLNYYGGLDRISAWHPKYQLRRRTHRRTCCGPPSTIKVVGTVLDEGCV